jgi:hypothetical protein
MHPAFAISSGSRKIALAVADTKTATRSEIRTASDIRKKLYVRSLSSLIFYLPFLPQLPALWISN